MIRFHARALCSLATALSLSACATTSKEKSLLTIGSAAVVGSAVGLGRGEEKTKNAVLYGTLFGLGAALVSLYVFDDSKDLKALRAEKEELKRTNEILRSEVAPKMQASGESLMSAPIPGDLKKLVQPGGWKRFRLDRWVQDDANENIWFRQTEMFEVTLPSLGSN